MLPIYIRIYVKNSYVLEYTKSKKVPLKMIYVNNCIQG